MKIGFVGIGYMGHGMAKNILEKGYSLKFKANIKRKAANDLISRGAIEEKNIQDLLRETTKRLREVGQKKLKEIIKD